MKLQNSSLLEYLVNIHVNIVDKKGTINAQSFDKKFNSADLLKNRREAIEYYYLSKIFFINNSGIIFSNHAESKLKDYKNYKSFSITLEVSDNNGTYIDINEPDSIFEFLDLESQVSKNYLPTSFIKVDALHGHRHSVLEEDFSFFHFLLLDS